MSFLAYSHMEMIILFNDTATTEIYTLSLHDALPIFWLGAGGHPSVTGPRRLITDVGMVQNPRWQPLLEAGHRQNLDRKSTRLNSSHANISYAVFCLPKI